VRSAILAIVALALAAGGAALLLRPSPSARQSSRSAAGESGDAAGLAGAPGGAPDGAVSGPSPIALRDVLGRLRDAIGEGDRQLVSALLQQVAAHGAGAQAILWEHLLSGRDESPAFLLHLGVLLGRVGDASTLARLIAESQNAAASSVVGYSGSAGTPTRARSVLNALIINALREFLRRPEFLEPARDLALAGAFDPAAHEEVRKSALLALALSGDEVAMQGIAERFESESDLAARKRILDALYSSKAPSAGTYLVSWYERFPELKREIALAISNAFEPEVALLLLRKRAVADLEREAESEALEAIRLISRKPSAFPCLQAAFLAEQAPALQAALLDSIAASGHPDAAQLVVDTARRSTSPSLREAALAQLPRVLRPEAAIEVLLEASERESSPAARQGLRYGLLNLMSDPAQGAAAARLLLREVEFRMLERDEASPLLAQMVASLPSPESRAALAVEFRALAGRVRNEGIRGALEEQAGFAESSGG
jgi:hypothetical protein